MEFVRTEITMPEDRKVTLKLQLPDSIPVGKAEVIVVIQPKNE